jgi:hypothetical protein
MCGAAEAEIPEERGVVDVGEHGGRHADSPAELSGHDGRP